MVFFARLSEQRAIGTVKLLIIEPFFGGSHREWTERIRSFSRHEVDVLYLEGCYWKWRMRGGAVLLAEEYLALDRAPEIILASSMLDLPTFLGMIAKGGASIPPVALFCHENQFLYPIPDDRPALKEQRDNFGSINWRSSLVADLNIFNSEFHRREALNAYHEFIRRAPDHKAGSLVERIRDRTTVYPPAPDLLSLDEEVGSSLPKGKAKALLWNHRWEAEKGPNAFASIIKDLIEEGYAFQLILAGPSGNEERIRKTLAEAYPERVIWSGPANDREEYLACLRAADLLLVTSEQDFFGLSVIEAMHQRTLPILPDRLAYPEHLSGKLEGLLYRGMEEAKDHLRQILEGNCPVSPEDAREAVLPYDIREWMEAFDQELGSLSKERNS